MKNLLFRFILISVFLLAVSSCKKDEAIVDPKPTDSIPVSTAQLASFKIKTVSGSTDVDYTNTFTDATGRQFSVSDFEYYLSEIVFIRHDNTEIAVNDTVILGDVNEKKFPLAIIPVGNYKGFKMIFGLDSAANHGDPTIYSEGHPLSLQNNAMHWGWNFGYIFMKMEGLADTTAAANGVVNKGYIYHIGSDKMKRELDYSNSPFTVTSGNNKILNLKIDLQQLLNSVDFTTDLFTMTPSNINLSSKLADNWQGAITVEP